jgi:hypothetical protein
MAESAVVVLVAAQGVNDPGGRLAQKTGGKQPPLQQPRVVEQEAVSGRECVIHGSTLR